MEKPRWPHGHIVKLYAHSSGRWAKKIRGKTEYFGSWEDPDAALGLYQRIGPELHAGRRPRLGATPDGGANVGKVVNTYLHMKAALLDAGEISMATWRSYKTVGEMIIRVLGRNASANHLGPPDFTRLRLAFAKRYGVHETGKCVTVTKMIFTWAFGDELIANMPRFGTTFKKPKAKLYREQKNQREVLGREEALTLIGSASVQVKAMILLGLNAAFGNTDCATLKLPQLDLDGGMVVHPRPKTGIQRACTLWPETVEALREAIENRRRPAKGVDQDLVFITRKGRPWVRMTAKRDEHGNIVKTVQHDAVGLEFNKLLEKHDLKQRGRRFYVLRHTFRTVADETEAQHAIYRIMGHSLPGMSEVYVHAVEAPRLKRVTDHVRGWLYG